MTLQFKVRHVNTRNGQQYQCLDIALENGFVTPAELSGITLPFELDLSRGVVFWGPAPTWLISRLVSLCAEAPWVGCFDVQSGSVIVASSRNSQLAAADSFRFLPDKPLGQALFIGGPPNSGKSALSYALTRQLKAARREKIVHLHRAQWDGEGSWYVEASDRALTEFLINYICYKIPKVLKNLR